MWEGYPYQKHCHHLGEYQRILMGYHVGGLIFHFMDARRNDFLEMLLHHTVALYLYGGSYMFNVWETGAVIAYIHDLSDISVSIIKIIAETEYKKTTAVLFVLHMILWFYLRNMVFPYLIYTCWITPIDFGHWCILPIYVYFLSCLFILHTHWFILFSKHLVKYAKDGSTNNEQEKIEVTKTKIS